MYQDNHANHRDAKRDKKSKMGIYGRSIFTIQQAESNRAKEIEIRNARKNKERNSFSYS